MGPPLRQVPRAAGDDPDFIDYGLLVIDRAVIRDLVPRGAIADLSAVLGALAADGRLAGFEATHRFYEIGSPEGLQELEARLAETVGGWGGVDDRPSGAAG